MPSRSCTLCSLPRAPPPDLVLISRMRPGGGHTVSQSWRRATPRVHRLTNLEGLGNVQVTALDVHGLVVGFRIALLIHSSTCPLLRLFPWRPRLDREAVCAWRQVDAVSNSVRLPLQGEGAGREGVAKTDHMTPMCCHVTHRCFTLPLSPVDSASLTCGVWA